MTAPFDGVPDEMQAIPRWLLWRRVRKPDGYVVKIPQHPSGRYAASAHAPSTWLAFDAAVRRLACKPTDWGGIGFALSADDDIGCVDLDGCHAPATGATARWAQRVLDLFAGAYVELSPSGMGFHIMARGAPPGLHHSKPMEERVVADKDPVLEAFSERQFITVTGEHVSGDGIPWLPDAWSEVQVLLDANIEPKAPKARLEDVELDDVVAALRFFSSDDLGGRNGLIGIALALKDAFGDEAFDAWAEWMARSRDDEGEQANRAMWDTLPDDSEHISVASIFWRARKAGWKGRMLDFDDEVERQRSAPIVDNSERRRLAPIKDH